MGMADAKAAVDPCRRAVLITVKLIQRSKDKSRLRGLGELTTAPLGTGEMADAKGAVDPGSSPFSSPSSWDFEVKRTAKKMKKKNQGKQQTQR
jgi:hypothetical protein